MIFWPRICLDMDGLACLDYMVEILLNTKKKKKSRKTQIGPQTI